MSKVNISATVDEDVEAFLSQDHVNASGLINDLVRRYMDGGDEKGAMLRLREEQLKSELEALSQQQEAKRKELDRLTDSREKAESGPDIADKLDDVLSQMEDGTHYWPNNDKVRSLATEARTDAADIIHRLKKRAVDQQRDIYHTQFKRADHARGETPRPIGEVFDVDE